MIVVLLVLALIAGTYLWLDYRKFADAPLTIQRPDATIDIARGETYRTIVEQLRGAGITRASPWYWRALGRELGIEGRLHAGEYALTPGLTPRELLRRMAVGEVLQHHFTIVDGWTFKQLRVALAAMQDLAQTLHDRVGRRHRASTRHRRTAIPEGWFLPETYSWVKGDSDFDVLKNAPTPRCSKTLDRLWSARAPDVDARIAVSGADPRFDRREGNRPRRTNGR